MRPERTVVIKELAHVVSYCSLFKPPCSRAARHKRTGPRVYEEDDTWSGFQSLLKPEIARLCPASKKTDSKCCTIGQPLGFLLSTAQANTQDLLLLPKRKEEHAPWPRSAAPCCLAPGAPWSVRRPEGKRHRHRRVGTGLLWLPASLSL